MIKNLSKKLRGNNKKKGFTLIELLIVMAIMVILAAVAVPKLGQYKETANEKAEMTSAKNIHTAINSLLADGKLSEGTDIDFSAADNANVKLVKGFVEESDLQGKTKGNTDKYFKASIDANGKIVITLDTKQIYPTN